MAWQLHKSIYASEKKKDNLTGTLKNKSWNKGIREKETSKNDAKKWNVAPSG